MKDKVVPGLFSKDCFLGIFIWIIPMSCFMLTLDVLAISGDSLIYSPILMALMLHPAFTKPIAILTQNISKMWKNFSRGKLTTENVFVCRLFTFSIDIYFAFIIGVQYYVFTSWLQFAKMNSVQVEGFTKLNFNLCTTNTTTENPNLNFQEVLTLLPSVEKSYALLGMSLLMVFYHIIKTCLINQFSIVPLSVFAFGPEEDVSSNTVVDLDEIELSSMSKEQIPIDQNQEHNGTSDVFCSLLAQLYIIGILLIPLIFDNFTNNSTFDKSKSFESWISFLSARGIPERFYILPNCCCCLHFNILHISAF